jgi:hemerythrin-like domain-containing protein
MKKTINDLLQEHEKIMKVLDIVEKVQEEKKLGEKEELNFYLELSEFIQTFADKCHHGKEEINLYHILAPLGDVSEKKMIEELVGEHNQSRSLQKEIQKAAEEGRLKDAAKAAGEYRKLLLSHISHENEKMFPSVEKRITNELDDTIYGRFLAVEKRTLGEAGVAGIDEMIRGWENL